MGIVMLATIVVLLFSRATRRVALVTALATAIILPAMMRLYDQVGYVGLLGVVHVAIWTPLAIYFWQRLEDAAIAAPFRQVMWVFLATMLVSLAFDYADVVRYALGERESLLSVAG